MDKNKEYTFTFEVKTEHKGELLRLYRVCNHLSQEQIGQMVGVNKATVCKYEKGGYEKTEKEDALDAIFYNVIKQYL